MLLPCIEFLYYTLHDRRMTETCCVWMFSEYMLCSAENIKYFAIFLFPVTAINACLQHRIRGSVLKLLLELSL
jgi:hypothetical protein